MGKRDVDSEVKLKGLYGSEAAALVANAPLWLGAAD